MTAHATTCDLLVRNRDCTCTCTWCGHEPHTTACARPIVTQAKGKPQPCPCAHHDRPRKVT